MPPETLDSERTVDEVWMSWDGVTVKFISSLMRVGIIGKTIASGNAHSR